MPRISEKLRCIDTMCQLASLDLLEDFEDQGEALDDAIDEILLLNSTRYMIPRNLVPKSDQWFTSVLPNYDDLRFQAFMRVPRQTFGWLLSLISSHQLFKSEKGPKQMPVEKQLAIALYKLGNDGSSNSILNVAATFGIGDGGSVMMIVQRIIKVILSFEKDWIQWPNEAERKQIEQTMTDKLPKCMGYLDGSHIELNEAPLDDPESYFTRKQRYAINVQAICDNQKIIRYAFIGFPGSVHDAELTPIQVLDNIHTNSYQMVNGLPAIRRMRYFSSHRVNIECTFGILKETFGSLKGLRIRVDRPRGHKLACDWILACCILYNMVKDSLPSFEIDLDEEEPEVLNDARNCNDSKRTALFHFVTGRLAIQ